MNHSAHVDEFRRASSDRRAGIACGLWLRVVLVGAAGLVTGMALLLQNITEPVGLRALLAGGAIAFFGWRRASAAYSQLDSVLPQVWGTAKAKALAGDSHGATPVLE